MNNVFNIKLQKSNVTWIMYFPRLIDKMSSTVDCWSLVSPYWRMILRIDISIKVCNETVTLMMAYYFYTFLSCKSHTKITFLGFIFDPSMFLSLFCRTRDSFLAMFLLAFAINCGSRPWLG